MSLMVRPLGVSYLNDSQLPGLIKKFEGIVEMPYDDGKGIATIGIGVNITNRPYLALTLKVLGVFSDSDSNELARRIQGGMANESEVERNARYIQIIDGFESIVDSVKLSRPADKRVGTSESEIALQKQLTSEIVKYRAQSTFEIDEPNAKEVVRKIIAGYVIGIDLDGDKKGFMLDRGKESTLDKRLLMRKDRRGVAYNVSIPHDTREYLSLMSLYFNSESLIGDKLIDAIRNGNRADAWFEIRYGSNGKGVEAGLAKRRFVEAQIFGLYDDFANVSLEEAKSAFKMLELHRKEILVYELKYGSPPPGTLVSGTLQLRDMIDRDPSSANADKSYAIAGTPYEVETLDESLDHAKKALLNQLRQDFPQIADRLTDSRFRASDVYFDPSIDTNHSSTLVATVYKSQEAQKRANLLVGEGGSDKLSGGKGNDVLFGGEGNDSLIGNKGDDALVGGAGLDTYLLSKGDGHDLIIDEDGNGSVQLNNKAINLAIHRAGDPAGEYRTLAGDILRFDSSDNSLVIIPAHSSDSITVKNYDKAQQSLGIELRDESVGYNNSGLWENALYYLGSLAQGALDFLVPAAHADSEVTVGEVLTDRTQSFQGSTGRDLIFADLSVSDLTAFLKADDGQSPVGRPGIVNTVLASSGEDMLVGGAERDRLEGGHDGDIIVGGDGNDELLGDSSAPSSVGDGNDAIFAGDGDDQVFAGGGDDLVFGGSGHDKIIANSGNDIVFGGEGDDDIAGESIFEVAAGTAYHDVLHGGAGNDTVRGMNGSDELYGEEGDDLLVGDDGSLPSSLAGSDVLYGGEGNDRLIGQGRDDYLAGEAGDDRLFGDSDDTPVDNHGGDYLNGGEGNDFLRGYGGDDSLLGEAGADELWGEDGDDLLDGGSGDDFLIAGKGNDILSGGEGIDALLGDEGDDILDGGDGDDHTAAGNAGLVGGAGSDTLYGGSGNDELEGDGLDVDSAEHGNDALYGDAGNDDLYGDGGNDTLSGGEGNDYLEAGAGDDLLTGDEGNDQLFAGEGNDFADGGVGDDELQGEEGDDELLGDEGYDRLFGQAGNDTLNGGTESDTLDGGAGNDIYVFEQGWGSDTIVNADQSGTDVIRLAEWTSIEPLSFERSGQIIDGGGVDLVIRAGADQIKVLNFFTVKTGVDRLELADGTVMSDHDIRLSLLAPTSSEDHLVGYASADVIAGEDGDDFLYGVGGNDTLSGGNGVDLLEGGAGQDQLDGGEGDDVLRGFDRIASSIDESADTLLGGLGQDALYGGEGSDTYVYRRGDGRDFISDSPNRIGASDDRLVLGPGILPQHVSFFAQTDELTVVIDNSVDQQISLGGYFRAEDFQIENLIFDGGTGPTWRAADIAARTEFGSQDTQVGGLGDDRFHVDHSGDVIIETEFGGRDSVLATRHYVLPNFVEILELSGVLNLQGTGNALDNLLIGNRGHNVLNGLAGNDTGYGGAGDDVYKNVEFVVELADEGNDTWYKPDGGVLPEQVENMSLADDSHGIHSLRSPVAAIGNSLNNTLMSSGNGYEGDTLDGGLGADTMIAVGFDSAVFIVDNPGDRVVASPFGGFRDEVVSSVDFILGADIELLTLRGTDPISGVGNSKNNVLNGYTNAAPNSLSGGKGNDRYLLGAGDIAVEGPDSGLDTIEIFSGAATLYSIGPFIERLILRDGVGAAGATGQDQANDQLIGNAFPNLLTGGTGRDSLSGAGGNDTLDGGGDDDSLTGGLGDDVYSVDATGDIVIEFAGEGNDSVQASADFRLPEFVENLELIGASALQGIGNAGNNRLLGNAVNNSLFGYSGNDTLDGGDGDDLLDGGSGSDTFIVNGRAQGTDLIRGDVADTLRLVGWRSDDVQFQRGSWLRRSDDDQESWEPGNGFDLRLFIPGGATGNVILSSFFKEDGGLGSTIGTIVFDDLAKDVASEFNGIKADQIRVSSGDDYTFGFLGSETISGGSGNDRLFGNGGIDALFGEDGDDYVYGAGSLDGGDGNDAIVTSLTANDTRTVFPTAIIGGSGEDSLYGALGNDTLVGGPGRDVAYGGGGNDLFLYRRNDGPDTIGSGVSGDLGIDTLRIEDVNLNELVFNREFDDLIVRVENQPADRIQISQFFAGVEKSSKQGLAFVEVPTDSGAGFTRLDFADLKRLSSQATQYSDWLQFEEGPLTVDGDVGDDRVFGAGSADSLLGGSGNDLIHGNGGDDTIKGGSEEDRLYGDAGNDQLYGDAGDDQIFGGAGLDWLSGDAGNDQLYDDQHGVLVGGTGNDILFGSLAQGGEGEDYIANARIADGGTGNDTIADLRTSALVWGGPGDDSIYFNRLVEPGEPQPHHVVAFNRGDGNDIWTAPLDSSATAPVTLSLGGGVRYSDLALRRVDSDLVLEVSRGEDLDSIRIEDWYESPGNRTLQTLQVILGANEEYVTSPETALHDKQIARFDFQSLVNAFDTASSVSPGLDRWSLINGLLTAHLGGSDDAALGGGLAYRIGHLGGLTGFSVNGAYNALNDPAFGTAPQAVQSESDPENAWKLA